MNRNIIPVINSTSPTRVVRKALIEAARARPTCASQCDARWQAHIPKPDEAYEQKPITSQAIKEFQRLDEMMSRSIAEAKSEM